MNRIDAGNFSRRFVGLSEQPSAVATERGVGGLRVGRRRTKSGRTAPEALGPPIVFGNENDEPKSRKAAASNGEFFDVESKTIVTIGKYEKDK